MGNVSERGALIKIDDQQAYAAADAALAMGVDVESRLHRHSWSSTTLAINRRHSNAPQKSAWGQRSFIDHAVIACRECIVHHDLNADLCEPSELIEVSERIGNVASHRFPPHAASAVSVNQMGFPGPILSRSAR